MDLLKIKDPSFIKDLSIEELNLLAGEIRVFLYENIAKTGGHLSSNLGVVELTLALHYVFDSPQDKFIFDVGHQSYVHKILTGRAKDFPTLRQYDGLSGFQKRSESVHDVWEAGHSSTSISAALGMAVARDLDNKDFNILPIIGDGSITNGMSFEALNHLGEEKKKVIVVFNDNNMSISKNVGGINKNFNKLRASKPYNVVKKDLSQTLSKNKVGGLVLDSLKGIRDTVKKNVIDYTIFSDFGLEYIGPIDGHNIKDLIRIFKFAKTHNGPIVLHIITKKGKGNKFCENDKLGSWHGVGPFDPKTGEMLSKLENDHYTWSEIISRTLVNLAYQDPDIVAITPAMTGGSKLDVFEQRFPNRMFDTGIAEEHATTFAAGLAAAGKKPFFSIYSTFLQRAYDQVNHDIARMNLPVVIGVDRAGIIGADGDTHQGVFDISILNNIPNMIICQPKDMVEAQDLLFSAFEYKVPVAIRYPRGSAYFSPNKNFNLIEKGTWTKAYWPETIDSVIITYGPDVDKFTNRIQANSLNTAVINARFIKPLDSSFLLEISKLKVPIFTYENEMLNGGLSSQIIAFYSDNNIDVKIKRFGIDDEFVEHGSIQSLRKHHNLDLNYVLNIIKNFSEKE